MRRGFACWFLLWAGLPVGALAHAVLLDAAPGAGARLSAPPAAVALRFSDALEVAFSSVTVTDEAGTRVDLGDLRAGAGANAVTEGLGVLKPGTYQVTWRAVSMDTHRSQGHYRFTIGR